jgi:hypothetical protein
MDLPSTQIVPPDDDSVASVGSKRPRAPSKKVLNECDPILLRDMLRAYVTLLAQVHGKDKLSTNYPHVLSVARSLGYQEDDLDWKKLLRRPNTEEESSQSSDEEEVSDSNGSDEEEASSSEEESD